MNGWWTKKRVIGDAMKAMACMLAISVLSEPASQGVESEQEKAWHQLSKKEQADIESRWDAFKNKSPSEQEELRAGLARYSQLSDAQKVLVNRAYERWKNLGEEQRQEIRQKFLRWKELSAQEREAVRNQVSQELKSGTAR